MSVISSVLPSHNNYRKDIEDRKKRMADRDIKDTYKLALDALEQEGFNKKLALLRIQRSTEKGSFRNVIVTNVETILKNRK